jgi:hypothetical protein
MPSQKTVRRLASLLGLTRAGIGLTAVVAPSIVASPWAGDDVQNPGGRLMTRAFGVRDAALGLGVHLAARRGAPLKSWLRLSALCDVGDAAATVAAGDDLGDMTSMTMALAGVGAISSFGLAALADS